MRCLGATGGDTLGGMSMFETVTVDQIPENATILDVREDDEWALGRAAGAQHLPLGQLPDRIEELDPDTDYYVICRTGGRSARAAEFMESRGYSAINIAGGSGAWLEAGKPMEADGDAEPTVKCPRRTPRRASGPTSTLPRGARFGRAPASRSWAPRAPSPRRRCARFPGLLSRR